MGLFGIGGGGGKVAKLEKRVMNKWGQAAERQRAMEMLGEIGTDEALDALLKRFTFRIDGAITDEEEKRLGYELLVAAGERAVAPVERFVATSDGVYWPLRALKEVVGIDAAVALLLRALDRSEQTSGRVNEVRAQLVSNLRDFTHPLVLQRLKVLSSDANDDVRIMALDALLTYGEEHALPIVVERILDPEETNRIKGVVFEQLLDLGWSLSPWREQLDAADVFPAHYRLGPQGRVVRA